MFLKILTALLSVLVESNIINTLITTYIYVLPNIYEGRAVREDWVQHARCLVFSLAKNESPKDVRSTSFYWH